MPTKTSRKFDKNYLPEKFKKNSQALTEHKNRRDQLDWLELL